MFIMLIRNNLNGDATRYLPAAMGFSAYVVNSKKIRQIYPERDSLENYKCMASFRLKLSRIKYSENYKT